MEWNDDNSSILNTSKKLTEFSTALFYGHKFKLMAISLIGSNPSLNGSKLDIILISCYVPFVIGEYQRLFVSIKFLVFSCDPFRIAWNQQRK